MRMAVLDEPEFNKADGRKKSKKTKRMSNEICVNN